MEDMEYQLSGDEGVVEDVSKEYDDYQLSGDAGAGVEDLDTEGGDYQLSGDALQALVEVSATRQHLHVAAEPSLEASMPPKKSPRTIKEKVRTYEAERIATRALPRVSGAPETAAARRLCAVQARHTPCRIQDQHDDPKF